jgi:hypothetical protein
MVKISTLIDYFILLQLILSILFLVIFHNKYEGIVVYFSIMIFISYWIIKVIFNKKYKDRLS